MNARSWIVTIIVVIVVGVGSFFGGVAFQKNKTASPVAASGGSAATAAGGRAAGSGRYGGTGTRTGGFAGAGGITGQIVSMDASSITVKAANGSADIVYFSSTTPIMKEVAATSSDLATGDNVIVRGTSSNGTVTATNITVVPTLPTAPAGGSAAASGTTNAPAMGNMPANMPMMPAGQ